MGNGSWYLDSELEFLRNRRCPTLIGLPFMRAAEGRVDLCHGKPLRISFERGPLYREAIPHSRRDGPAGCPDPEHSILPRSAGISLRPRHRLVAQSSEPVKSAARLETTVAS